LAFFHSKDKHISLAGFTSLLGKLLDKFFESKTFIFFKELFILSCLIFSKKFLEKLHFSSLAANPFFSFSSLVTGLPKRDIIDFGIFSN